MSPFGSGRWTRGWVCEGAGSVFHGPATGAVPQNTRAPVGGRWETRRRAGAALIGAMFCCGAVAPRPGHTQAVGPVVLASCARSRRTGRVAEGGFPPPAPTDPDVPNSGIRLLGLRYSCAVDAMHDRRSGERVALMAQAQEAEPVARFADSVATAHATLGSGWLVNLGRSGLSPAGALRRFPSRYITSPFTKLRLAQDKPVPYRRPGIRVKTPCARARRANSGS